jgi:diadenosine tetraphosphate (Ap4A) HIT family hydrolase
MNTAAPNTTAAKFGYPATLVAAYRHWLVLVRPQQPTLGSLVLVCSDSARAFSQISPAAFGELGEVTRDLESTLRTVFQPDKLNYLMLMMVDPDVHFHVLPRYEGSRRFAGQDFADAFWPKPVDLTQPAPSDPAVNAAIAEALKQAWPQRSV